MIESDMSSSKRILIIDDHLNAAVAFKSNMELLNKDLDISLLASAEEALLDFKNNQYDLVIADIILPGMSGFELLEYIKKVHPTTKVFIVSGVADRDIKKQISQAGADAFFYKPVDIAEFLDAVERSLGYVGTLLTPELEIEVEEEEENKTPGLPEKLSNLRKGVEAHSVFLLGKVGQILMSDGELPEEFESTFVPKLFHLVEQRESVPEEIKSLAPRNMHTFRISDYDIFTVHFVSSYLLLVILPKGQSVDLSIIYQSADQIYNNLQNLGVTTVLDASVLDMLELDEEDEKKSPGEDTDVLLERALELDLNPDDVDSFWNEIDNSNNTIPEAGTSSLSYDEAKDRGLDMPQADSTQN